ncbi:arginyl-tRNA synthetase [Desulfofarcimen acetoxidans DSM 771]|uniref:Arginine--tRNA ligase n=1 Tax=Desulfofarcimen acetoxidans (strain ATCC 49208 / DSM 771 / KCTC 5769 / VKM B-1644 / 5575) TaxID=485916 RepID=C8VVE6_DESAS|nr:arginine--tRNA ligase [Desulfofarcimen acetoxidans]ACV61015.1 arginyl-tRNA synthetase [Desulfofarcimen acetoxidans DSM 771]
MGGMVNEVRVNLKRILECAFKDINNNGIFHADKLPEFVVEVPREKGHGDFASNLAMMLAKPARMAPRRIAEIFVEHLNEEIKSDKQDGSFILLDRVEVAGPGFINFYLNPAWVYETLRIIETEGNDYGRVMLGSGKKVQVEFVSANPTGLLHMGNARGAALGDCLASLLDFAGYQVTREFYVNDAGNQIENFGLTLEARYLQLLGQDCPVPEDGYHGLDIIQTMQGFVDKYGNKFLSAPGKVRRMVMINYALEEKLREIRNTLFDFGVRYDVWFSEKDLHESGAVNEAVAILKEKGHIYEKEGALWFKATEFGVEKDEVVVRSNGVPTYFAADIAYHKNKFDRGFDRVINIWGADHHGHVSRVKGAVEAIGYDPESLDIILMQLVRLFRGTEIVRMSKRTGQFVTLDELIEEVGRDVARYFFVMRSADSHLDFDLELAKSQSNENPVYYIQYAHARICSILRQLDEQGGRLPQAGAVDLALLKEEIELDLIRKMADFPEEIASAAESLAPHRLARYVHELAGLLHSFYNSHRVIVDDAALSEARLVLVMSVKTVIKNALSLLGIAAPEKM